jgi:hypothetical protein
LTLLCASAATGIPTIAGTAMTNSERFNRLNMIVASGNDVPATW